MAKPRFNNVKQVQPLIDKYFKECHSQRIDKVVKEHARGKPIRELETGDFEYIPAVDKEGNPIIEQTTPYTITGLVLALGLSSRKELMNYEHKKHKTLTPLVKSAISHAIKRAKLKVLDALELMILTSTTPAGAIFMGKARHKMIEHEKTLAQKHTLDIKYDISLPQQINTDSKGRIIDGE